MSEPAHQGVGIGDDCRQRLVDLVEIDAASSPMVLTRVTWASSVWTLARASAICLRPVMSSAIPHTL